MLPDFDALMLADGAPRYLLSAIRGLIFRRMNAILRCEMPLFTS